MRLMSWIVKAGLIAFLGCSPVAQAEMQVIKPAREMVKIKLKDKNIYLLNTVIELNNAHPIEIISFFLPNAHGVAQQVAFEISDDYQPNLTMRSGADCAVSAVSILQENDSLRVVYASRKGNWADKKVVVFTVYDLARNESGMPGTPDLYFKQTKKIDTTSSYCDAKAALTAEAALYR
jgi:hypothetical protein